MTGVRPPFELRRHDGAAVRSDAGLRQTLAEIYAEAFSDPPYDEPAARGQAWAGGPLVRHTTLAGFELVTAVRGPEVLGFGYGVIGAEDSWFAGYIREHAPGEISQAWLGGHGELVELAVRTGARGLGVGARLHDAVIEHLREIGVARALLVTQTAAAPARALYRNRGWQDLVELSEGSMLMGMQMASPPA